MYSVGSWERYGGFEWVLLDGEPLLSFTNSPCWNSTRVRFLPARESGLLGAAWDALEFA